METNKKLSAVELRVKDAETKLKQLKDLDEQLTRVRYNIKELGETDTEIPTITDEIEKTWKDFILDIEAATR